MGIVTDRALEIILGALVALLGGGKIWEWLSGRNKGNAEASHIAMDTAMEAMTQTVGFLKTRVVELSVEIEAESKGRRESERQMNYFQSQLEDVRLENKRLKEQLSTMAGGRRLTDVQLTDLVELRKENESLRTEIARLHDEIGELRAIMEAKAEC